MKFLDALNRISALKAEIPGFVRSAEHEIVDKTSGTPLHAFDLRNVHPKLHGKPKRLFDDGYYAEATFEATKYLEHVVRKLSKIKGKAGYQLMMTALAPENPQIKLNKLESDSEKDEQSGYRYIFAGVSTAIRNPRGHETNYEDTPDECLDSLGVVSMLLRRIEAAGLILP